MNGPVVITAQASGSGAGSVGGVIPFDPRQHLQRPGLLLSNGAVYVAFGSHMDQSPWHGWVMTYDASDLSAQRGVFLTSQNGEGGAIWQSGRGLAADDAGNVYSMTGNGDFDGAGDFGESFLKLSGAGAVLADWFTPAIWKTLTDVDADLSTGPALIPGTHNLVGGDKYGQLYLLNGDAMGKLDSSGAESSPIFSGAVIGGMFNFALWNRLGTTYVYVQGYQDVVKSYEISDAKFNPTPVSSGLTPVAAPRVGMTISANGVRNGILWETTGDFTSPSVPGTLHAFDAMNLSNELWNSSENAAEDSLGRFAKFVNPTVANGKVYVATSSGAVVVYGSLCANDVQSALACAPRCRVPARMEGRCLTGEVASRPATMRN